MPVGPSQAIQVGAEPLRWPEIQPQTDKRGMKSRQSPRSRAVEWMLMRSFLCPGSPQQDIDKIHTGAPMGPEELCQLLNR